VKDLFSKTKSFISFSTTLIVMKKIIFLIIALAIVLAPIFVFAAGDYGLSETLNATGGALKKTVAGESDLPSVAGKIISAGLSLIAIIFFILFLYAGLTWMKAMGSSEDVEKAKKTLEAAVIGLVIVLGAYAATKFVFENINSSGGDGSGNVPAGEIADGTACKISNNKWAGPGVDLIGENGKFNCGPGKNSCKESDGECQPACRYSNKNAFCVKKGDESDDIKSGCPGEPGIVCSVLKK
jgi:hypothetical protein